MALATLIACETGVRLIGPSISKDIRHIRQFPKIAQTLDKDRRLRILFLGNSLTKAGADVDAFKSELNSIGLDPACAITAPDNTVLFDWYYVFKNVFESTDKAPDMLIVGFYKAQMEDSTKTFTRSFGHDFCNLRENATEVFEHEFTEFEDRASFIISSFSSAYTYQNRIKKRVMDVILPDCRVAMSRLNRMEKAAGESRQAKNRVKPPPTYNRLKRFIAMAKRARTHVVFVAMPPGNWSLDTEIPKIVEHSGMTFVDCRIDSLPTLPSDYFSDGYHLNEAGAAIYSRFLAEKLVPEIRRLTSRR